MLASAVQPMLWGTGDAWGAWDMIGTQDPFQFDENNPPDGIHTPSECYTYSFSGLCPSVLGAMIQFWGQRADPCYADFNGDGTVNSRDFLTYLGAWASGDLAADCDENGIINTQDFLCFLGLWATGC